MSQNNTDIQLKRSISSLESLKEINLEFGEPIFIDNTTTDSSGFLADPVKSYLVIGRKLKDGETNTIDVQRSPVFKAFSKEMVNNLVFYDEDNDTIINEAGDEVPVASLTVKEVAPTASDTFKYHILCQKEGDTHVYKFPIDNIGIFVNGRGIMHGAAWNDYAEFRICEDSVLPGQVVCDNGDGTLSLSNEKYQPCAHIVSDTYGQIIGDNKNSIPIAVAGRALVAVGDDVQIGDCICAGPHGCGVKMTRQEVVNYPDRIIGVVCEIPKTQFIGSIEINGRVWVNIK